MFKTIGIKNIHELFGSLKSAKIDLPKHQGEIEVENFLKDLSEKNRAAGDGPFFLGAGCYRHHIPAAVDHLIQRSEFLTSYTPYQPEIAQGTLAVIFQFQSIIALLTGMEVANASMYDGATALAEACMMALRIKQGRKKIAITGALHPDYRAVVETYLDLYDAELTDKVSEECAAVICQYPDFYGNITDLDDVREKASAADALMIVCVTEVLALGLLDAPKQADIVVGEAASLGAGMNFGGPMLGFFATKREFVRQMPGRLCGATTDANGEVGYVLTLNAREQHIRREKATSNICTNQGLCATAFTIHASLLGEIGFKKLALLNHKKACDLADRLAKIPGVKVLNQTFFNEFTIEFHKSAEAINKKLLKKNIIGGYAEGKKMIVAVSELTSNEDMSEFAKALSASLK